MSLSEVETSVKEIWEMFKDTDARFKETDVKFKETDRRLDKRFVETDKRIKELATLFTGQWGKLIESLAESGLLEQLQSRGIKVTGLSRRLTNRKNGHHIELDFLLTNETEVVLGEVKTTLKSNDVRAFIKKLGEFLYFYPNYNGFKIYGAMIGLRLEEESEIYAYRQGLFVFKVGGKGMLQLLNDDKFTPKDFASV
ncbi:hypothetical protein ISS22_14145 [candidate division KSB1 bacterium]|nr:hypothetical protein [candidate division KSB1 bacterium]